MIILRSKSYSLRSWLRKKPKTFLGSIYRDRYVNARRWKDFNKEMGRSRWRLNLGQTRREYLKWQRDNYGDIIY